MGKTLTSDSEAALVNLLRGRGRPKKTQTQKYEIDSMRSILEEDKLDVDKESGESVLIAEEGAKHDSRYSVEGSPLPPTPPLECRGTLNLSSSTPKIVQEI